MSNPERPHVLVPAAGDIVMIDDLALAEVTIPFMGDGIVVVTFPDDHVSVRVEVDRLKKVGSTLR
jgi:hypothetical protein